MRQRIQYLSCCLFLIWAQSIFAQSKDSLNQSKNAYPFIGVMPSFAGILTFGQPHQYADIYIPGMSLGYGKAKNKLLYGISVAYQHYFIEGWKDANKYTIGPFAEYHFRPAQKMTWLVGVNTYLLIWQYVPQTPNFRFFNDPLDGKSRVHFIPVVFPYIGGDFKIKQKYHLVVGAGYDFKFTARSGIPPFAGRFGMIFDFRVPIRKR